MSTRSTRNNPVEEEPEEAKTDEMEVDKEEEEETKEEDKEEEEEEEDAEGDDKEEEAVDNGGDEKKDTTEEDKEAEGEEADDDKEKNGDKDGEKEEEDAAEEKEEVETGEDKEDDKKADEEEDQGEGKENKEVTETPKDKEPKAEPAKVAQIILEPPPPAPLDPELVRQQELIDNTPRTTELEHALFDTLKRKENQVDRLSGEVMKLKAFISKRKQTYKRKRKDEGAPTRALSAYNIFVQDRFSRLAKENEKALNSADTDAVMKRVPPASLVASTGNQWKELNAEDKSHYEERAREDRKRYEEQMAKYQPPDKQANRKRNKTGYNMFFSAHVLRLKQSEAGVPSERGSVARLVGNAWKQLTAEEKQYYEREADKMNGMNPVDKEDDDEEGEDKRPPMTEYPPNYPVQHGEMHMHAGMPPPMHGHPQHAGQHDPRQSHHYYPPNYPYAQPPYHGYHEQAAAAAQGQHRGHPAYAQGRAAHAAHYQYPPHGHPGYDQRGMGM